MPIVIIIIITTLTTTTRTTRRLLRQHHHQNHHHLTPHHHHHHLIVDVDVVKHCYHVRTAHNSNMAQVVVIIIIIMVTGALYVLASIGRAKISQLTAAAITIIATTTMPCSTIAFQFN